MGKLKCTISMSLDGFITGPEPGPDQGLGAGGERLHEWVFGLAAWREPHGLSGGETGPDNDVIAEATANTGAVIMGRRMFGGPPDHGPWGDDPGDGWWGDEPPFRVPVFILTNHARERVDKRGGTSYTFVTDGIESALRLAREAAGDKDVSVAGGANVIQQYLAAGLLDELQISLVPVLLGGGTPLFQPGQRAELDYTRVIEGRGVTHLRFSPKR